jgi:hypothetical protein
MVEGGVKWGRLAVLVAALARSAAAAADEQPPAAPPAPAEAPPASSLEPARPSDVSKVECVAHHEDAQLVRRQSKLLAARSALLVCSRASCPPAIRADCVDWLEEVNRSVPSVVVTARERGADVTDVRVLIDGELAASRLSGGALEADPGAHQFRFESPRFPAIERAVLMGEGMRNRPIEVEFAPAVTAAGPPGTPPPRALTRSDYVFAAVAAAGVAASLSLGAVAIYERHELEGSCGPSCTDAQVSPIRTKLIVADVALGVAAASLAVGLYRYFTRPLPPLATAGSARDLALDVGVSSAGGSIDLRGAF